MVPPLEAVVPDLPPEAIPSQDDYDDYGPEDSTWGTGEPYAPFPDADMPEPIDPQRVADLERKVALLASRCAVQRQALGVLLNRALPLADSGLAPWYQAARHAYLGTDPGSLGLGPAD